MADWVKLGKLLGMLGSEYDGERLNAARMLERALKSEGKSFGDLSQRVMAGPEIRPVTVVVDRPVHVHRKNDAADIANKILDVALNRLTRQERRFLGDVARAADWTDGYYELTTAQANWLNLLERQYLSPPPKPPPKARKPRPVPEGLIDDLGLGDPPPQRKPKRQRVMPDATIDEAVREAACGEAWDDPGIFGKDPQPHDPQGGVKRRFESLDIEEDGLDNDPPF